MTQSRLITALLCLTVILAACNVTSNEDGQEPTEPSFSTATPQTLVTNTPTLSPTVTPQPTATTAPTSTACTNDLDFVEDVTIPDGSEVEAAAAFVKTWRVRNSGTCTWNSNYRFVQTDWEGNFFSMAGGQRFIAAPQTAPGMTVDISVTLIPSPESTAGETYRSVFQMQAPNGTLFGQTPFVEATVVLPSGSGCFNGLEFVADVTIPDGTIVARGSTFEKTWTVKNSGTCAWSSDYRFIFLNPDGNPLQLRNTANAGYITPPDAAPGATVNITVPFSVSGSVANATEATARFQMRAPNGATFGQTPYVKVVIQN